MIVWEGSSKQSTLDPRKLFGKKYYFEPRTFQDGRNVNPQCLNLFSLIVGLVLISDQRKGRGLVSFH